MIYPDFSMPLEYYESFDFKCQTKIYELRKDCLNYRFCPICTNVLEEKIGINPLIRFRQKYIYCDKDKFYLNEKEFNFTINKIIYRFLSHNNNVFSRKFIDNKNYFSYNDINVCNYSDLINPNELNSLSIIKLYKNLNKFLIFK